MVEKVVIRDNSKSPIRYIENLDNFKNGTEYVFKPGVNVIVGENGCGKTTLLNLIKAYLLVDYEECSLGMYNCNINNLLTGSLLDKEKRGIFDGIDVYADYKKNTFRLSHAGEKARNQAMTDFRDFGTFMDQNTASTGEGVLVAIGSLFNYMFSKDAKLSFDYEQPKITENYHAYCEYVKNHRVETADEYTIIMDEPDRNLSLDNIEDVKNILSFHKEQTQIISVIHNPLLIYALSDNKEANFIEMTNGYIKKIRKQINSIVKKV